MQGADPFVEAALQIRPLVTGHPYRLLAHAVHGCAQLLVRVTGKVEVVGTAANKVPHCG